MLLLFLYNYYCYIACPRYVCVCAIFLTTTIYIEFMRKYYNIFSFFPSYDRIFFIVVIIIYIFDCTKLFIFNDLSSSSIPIPPSYHFSSLAYPAILNFLSLLLISICLYLYTPPNYSHPPPPNYSHPPLFAIISSVTYSLFPHSYNAYGSMYLFIS